MRNTLSTRNGKAVMPPSAMKFPAAVGDQWNSGLDAPNTGRLDSQAPRMKKQVMANQHIQARTPHWEGDMWNLRRKECFDLGVCVFEEVDAGLGVVIFSSGVIPSERRAPEALEAEEVVHWSIWPVQ